MSPTVRHDRRALDLDAVTPVVIPRRARWYSVVVLVIALAFTAALALGGAALPDPGLMLLLAIPFALCMNRYLFFPNEVGVTADAAVMFAALVAFRGDAQWLGPLLLALLAGPLDARHWGARAFTRMAFNSGSTALTAAAGLAAFVPLSHAFGTGWEATLGAAALAAVPYIVVESVVGISLVLLLGEPPADAARDQLPQGCIVLPLALVGAAAGLAAAGVGGWLALLLLLPVPFVPELAFVVVRRRLRRRALDVGLVTIGLGCLVASVVVADPTASVVAGLVGLGLLVLVENPPRRSAPLPPFAAVLIAAPVAMLGTGSSAEAVIVASAAGAVYLAAARVCDRRSWWSLPLVPLVATLGAATTEPSVVSALSLVTGAFTGTLLAAAWGPLPWSSRVVGRFAASHCAFTRRPTLVLVTAGPPTAVVVAIVGDGTVRTTAALGAVALVELGAFAAALAVRMWRFAPRRRIVDLAVLTIAAIAAVVWLPFAERGQPLAVGAAIGCSVAIAFVAVPLSRLNARLEELDVAHGQ
jgi:hypothetical protein